MNQKRLAVLFSAVLSGAVGSTTAEIAPCAKSPEEAWRLAQEAVSSKDAGRVMLTFTPTYRTQNAVEYAVGASMVAEISGLSGELSGNPAAVEKAKKAEQRLLLELDAILVKHKAPTIAQIGTPRLMKMRDPAVQARFAKIDHVAYAREMESFFLKAEAAAKEAGVSSPGPTKLDELVVGGGALSASLAPAIVGETARAAAGSTTMLFRKVNGCWLIDGREDQPR